ncbi:MAG TPA: ABC transporter permease, partial [Bryobacteraceae bacterium]|nr:ABC transporter permease [Bryobacteraceae bacterium]
MKLLRTLILRPLVRDPLRTALTWLAVALGIAVVVAIDLAGDAATGSFRSSLETLAGKTDLEISANGGIEEQWIGRLAALPINVHFAPLVESQILIPRIGSIPIYGLDFISEAQSNGAGGEGSPEQLEPNYAVISKPLADRLDARVGQSLAAVIGGAPQTLHVGRIVAGSTDFVAVDIADAQQLLSRFGRLDRIDVTVAPSEDFD